MAMRFFLRSRCRSLLSASATRPYVSTPTATTAGLRAAVYDVAARQFSTKQGASTFDSLKPVYGSDSKLSNQASMKREDIMLDGCDFEHWLIMMEKPHGELSRDEIIDSYIQTLVKIVGSEEEAKMKIYSVSTKHYYAFSCLLSEEVAKKLNGLPGVSWVLPDAYVDVKNKDYGGEPFVNGQAVPYDPKYHEEWVRNNSRAKGKTPGGDRPRGGGNRNRAPASGNIASK